MTGSYGYSSPGRRGPFDPWFRVGTNDVDTTTLVTALGVLSMVVYAINKTLLVHLALLPDDIRHGQVWRLITWPLINVPSLGTVLALFFFWYFGRELERVMGRNRFALFLALLAVVPALIGTVANWQIEIVNNGVGIDLIEISVFLCFVVRQPGARFFFGIQAWVFGAVIVGVRVLQLMGDNLWDALWLFVVTIALALLLLRSWGFADEATWIPRIPWPAAGRGLRSGGGNAHRGRGSGGGRERRKRGLGRKQRRTKKRNAPDLRVVVPPPPPPNAVPHVPAEIDALLDKIAASGLESLSPAERQQLDQASKRLRDDRS
jgi:membrane associated rhomboid family serine protease